MSNKQQREFISRYSDRVLNIVYSSQDMTTSDLQGCIEAVFISILHELKGKDERSLLELLGQKSDKNTTKRLTNLRGML